MHQFKEQERFLKKKKRKIKNKKRGEKRRKTDIVTLGDLSVRSSGPLIHDCNLTALHVCTHTTFTDRGVQCWSCVFFLLVSYKRHIKWNKALFFYIKQWTFFFFFLLRTLMCQLNCPSKEVWGKRESIEHCMLQQTNCWIHSIHETNWLVFLIMTWLEAPMTVTPAS